MAAREVTAARVAAETGASFIPPYDYGPVIAGQGTIGLELLQQVGTGIIIIRSASSGCILEVLQQLPTLQILMTLRWCLSLVTACTPCSASFF
jgi:threonine dehydratase